MLFRVRKPLVWAGVSYEPGDCVEIEEGNPRIRVMVEQSHHLEYANRSPDVVANVPKSPAVTFRPT